MNRSMLSQHLVRPIAAVGLLAAGMLSGCVERQVVYVPGPQYGPGQYAPPGQYVPPAPQPLPDPSPTGYSGYSQPSGAGQQLSPNPAPAPAPTPGPSPYAPAANVNLAIQQLVAPIALYPDPLLAQVLAASTYPQQVQQAAQWLAVNPRPPEVFINSQPWDPSVRALVHYPSVLNYMAADPGWMSALGSAFIEHQPQVMEAIQDLRAQAIAMGNLADNEHQVIVRSGPSIYIEPINPGVIYVPSYDPVIVYQEHYGVAYTVWYPGGVWLGSEFDWDNHYVYIGPWYDWHHEWYHGPYGWTRDPHFHREGGIWWHNSRYGEAPHGELRHEYGVRPGIGHEDHPGAGRNFRAAPSRGGRGGEHDGHDGHR